MVNSLNLFGFGLFFPFVSHNSCLNFVDFVPQISQRRIEREREREREETSFGCKI